MAKTTETAAEQLDLSVLVTLDDHPLVRPLAETHRQLRADQTRLTSELVEVRKSIFAAESDASDPRVPPRSLRQAWQRAEQIQEELDEVRVALFASTEALEAARSEARAELRPWVRKEATQLLTSVLEAAEILLEAQTVLQILERRARRLGVGIALGARAGSHPPGRACGRYPFCPRGHRQGGCS